MSLLLKYIYSGKFYHGKYLNVGIALSKEECAQKLQARFGSQYIPSYHMPSFVRTPVVYDPSYWQSNAYGRMQVFPNYKPKEGVYSSYDKDQKIQNPLINYEAYFPKGSSANKANHDQVGLSIYLISF